MPPLLLLHGAIGASAQLQPLYEQLATTHKVYCLDFTGHGGRPDTDAAFSIGAFADDVLRFMEQEEIAKASIFGYSMGGYVGMYLARHYPEQVDKLVTLATKYHWDEATAAKEVLMLNPDKIEQKIPAFAAVLRERYAPCDWKEGLRKTSEMMLALGKHNTLNAGDYSQIATPALLLLGDRDKMAGLEETQAVYKLLPNAQMGVLPNTQHPIEQVDMAMLSFMIRRFVQ